jgi:hypothetical protein
MGWREQAECQHHPHDWWLNEALVAYSRPICARCPVAGECLAEVTAWDAQRGFEYRSAGIYAGMTTLERTGRTTSGKVKIKAATRREQGAKCVICGTHMPDRGHGTPPRYCGKMCAWKARVQRQRRSVA